jgi:hypothetical protein
MRVSAVERPHAAWRCLGLVLVPLLAACATAFEAPPSPAAVQAVRVGPTVDQSGKLPLLRGDTVLGRLFRIRKITVGEALADDAGRFLRKRGFVVATTREASAAPVLRFEVRRWDEEPPSTPAVTVSVVARLVDPHTQEALWTAECRDWRIPTLGAPTVFEARAQAVRSVVRALLANWKIPPIP